MKYDLKYKSFGDKALLIEWPEEISELILNDIISFKAKIESESILKNETIINGYNSLTIKYKDEIIDLEIETEKLKKTYSNGSLVGKIKPVTWQIPVCYDEVFGIDIKQLSKDKNSTVEAIINLHSKTIYTVYFIGFLPGFLYLGGLNEVLYSDRKATPRLNVTKGSVAIGGSQTGVYPNNSAGGWNIIGKSPVSFFDIKKAEPCFAKSGDKIQFLPVSMKDFIHIENQIKDGQFQLKPKFDD